MPDRGKAPKSAPSLNADDRAAGSEALPAALGDLDEEEADSLWAKEAARRRRARNWAMLAVLLGLSALFYAITIAKMKVHG